MDFLIHADYILFHFINQTLSSSWQDSFFPAITDLHKNIWFNLVIYPVLFGFYIYKFKRMGFFYFLFCIISVAMTDFSGNRILKKEIQRPRPFQTEGLEVNKRSNAHGGSFISNHTANMFAFAAYSTAFFPAGRFAFYGIASLIGYSRIYNGVHFPLDVICGALWGISISFIFIFAAQWIAKKFRLEKESRII